LVIIHKKRFPKHGALPAPGLLDRKEAEEDASYLLLKTRVVDPD
jgi:hypothetical protein